MRRDAIAVIRVGPVEVVVVSVLGPRPLSSVHRRRCTRTFLQ